jgi:hypothetical protein
MFRSRTEDRRTISCWRLAVASPHSAISAMVRPQPVQTLEQRQPHFESKKRDASFRIAR